MCSTSVFPKHSVTRKYQEVVQCQWLKQSKQLSWHISLFKAQQRAVVFLCCCLNPLLLRSACLRLLPPAAARLKLQRFHWAARVSRTTKQRAHQSNTKSHSTAVLLSTGSNFQANTFLWPHPNQWCHSRYSANHSWWNTPAAASLIGARRVAWCVGSVQQQISLCAILHPCQLYKQLSTGRCFPS